MINRLSGMDYSQGLPTPDGAGGLDSVGSIDTPMGDLGAAGDATPGIIGLVASIAAFAGGILLSSYSHKEAPMPASMKPLFRTGVKWLEPDPAVYVVATILEIGGVIGIIASSAYLRSSR